MRIFASQFCSGGWAHLHVFHQFYKGEQLSYRPICFFGRWRDAFFQNSATLKGKNDSYFVSLRIDFKRKTYTKMKIVELLSLYIEAFSE